MRFWKLLLTFSIIGTGCFQTPQGSLDTLSGDHSDSTADGGGSTPTPSPLPQGDYGIIFVSTTLVNGSGATSGTGSGIAAMDAVCASEATSKQFGGTFKAMISGHGLNRRPGGSDWVLKPSAQYRREDMTTVIGTTTSGSVFTWPLTNAMTSSAKYPWTGAYGDGSGIYPSQDAAMDPNSVEGQCDGWTSSDSFYKGSYGKSSLSGLVNVTYDTFGNTRDNSYLYYIESDDLTTRGCDLLKPIYCAQEYVKPIPTGPFKTVFLSLGSAQGNAGYSGFDAICASGATTKGYSGTYKAMVVGKGGYDGVFSSLPARRACSTANCSTGVGENIDWVFHANTHYKQEGVASVSTFVGTTNASGIFDEMRNGFSATTADVWTGLSPTWAPAIIDGISQNGTCTDWGINDPSYGGSIGSSSGSINIGSGGNCNVARKVICVEQ